MISFLLDLLQLLRNFFPLFFSLFVYIGLALLCAKSIKKHASVYYAIFSIPFLLLLVPFLLNKCGADIPRLNIPVLSYFMRDYVHMAPLGFPLLIVIMYMGALSTRNRYVARLMSIRKELSIIAGFPILTHATMRAFGAFPRGISFFFDQEDYLAEHPVYSMLGATFTNFVFILGIIMLALFLVLWVTSFDGVHRKLGNQRWKKIQRWAYVLYALLFIHSMGLQIGGLLTRQAKEKAEKTPTYALLAMNSNTGAGMTAISQQEDNGQAAEGHEGRRHGRHKREGEKGSKADKSWNGRKSNKEKYEKKSERPYERNHQEASHENSRRAMTEKSHFEGSERESDSNRQRASTNGRESKNREGKGEKGSAGKRKGGIDLSEIKPDRNTSSYIHIFSVVLIFGSYLILRIRKAKTDHRRKNA